MTPILLFSSFGTLNVKDYWRNNIGYLENKTSFSKVFSQTKSSTHFLQQVGIKLTSLQDTRWLHHWRGLEIAGRWPQQMFLWNLFDDFKLYEQNHRYWLSSNFLWFHKLNLCRGGFHNPYQLLKADLVDRTENDPENWWRTWFHSKSNKFFYIWNSESSKVFRERLVIEAIQ